MRVGFFTDTYTPQINGVVTSIRLFKEHLERLGHEVYVFAPGPDHEVDTAEIVRFRSVPFKFQPEMRFAAPYSVEAARVVDSVGLDIVHSHDPFSIGLFGIRVARKLGIPYVHTYHTLFPEYVHYIWETRLTKRLAERLSRDFCSRCDHVIAPSAKIERYLACLRLDVPVTVLPTGVETGKFQDPSGERRKEFRRRFGIQTDERLLVYVGRLGREKSVDVLVDMMARVRTPGVRLLIVGDGPERPSLEDRARAARVAERVLFTGYLAHEDVCAAYAAADLFVFASLTETQGLVIGEAMAAGLPVVASEDLAIADAVAPGINGLLVRPGEIPAFSAAVDRIFGEPGLLETMSVMSSLRAEDMSMPKRARELEEVYAGCVDAARGRRTRWSLAKRREGVGAAL